MGSEIRECGLPLPGKLYRCVGYALKNGRCRDHGGSSEPMKADRGIFRFVLPTPDGGWTLSERAVICGEASNG